MAYVIDDDENRTQEILARLEELEIQTFSSQVVGRNESTRNTGIESGDVAAVNPYPQWIPIRDYGTLGNLTLLIDQTRVDGHIAKMTINGDIDFAFEFPPPESIFEIQVGKMMQFIVDATIDAVGGYTINLPASVVPSGIEIDNTANARTVLRFTTTDRGTTYLAETLGGSPTTIPAGTAQFQHLEWNGTAWINQQQLAFGTLHADAGQLQFTNNQIGLAWRDNADTENLEMKVTDGNVFDFTYGKESALGMQLRSQNDIDPDNTLNFFIGSGIDNLALIESSTPFLNFGAGGATRLFLDTSTVTKLILKVPDVSTASADFNVVSNDTGTGNESLGLAMGFGTSGVALIESSTAFLNIGAGGVSRLFLDVSSITKLNLESPDNVTATANFNIISKHTSQDDNVLGLTIGSGTGAIGLIDNSTPNLNIATAGLTRIVVSVTGIEMQNNDIVALNALGFTDGGGQIAGSTTNINFVHNTGFRFTANAENILDITDSGLTILGTNNIALGNNNITGVNQLAFNESGQTITDSTSGIIYSVPDTQDTHTFVIDGNAPVTMEKFFLNLSNTRIQMTQALDPGFPVAGDIFVYAKESGGLAALFYRQSNGTIVGPLGGGGGGNGPPFNDNIPLVQDNLDNTRLFQIDAGSILSGTTSVLGTVTLTTGRTWFLPDATTTLAGLAVSQTFTGLNRFTSTGSFENSGNAISVSGDIQMNGNNIDELANITFNVGGSIESRSNGIDIKSADANKEIILNVGAVSELKVARDNTAFCQLEGSIVGFGPEIRIFNNDPTFGDNDIVGAINFNGDNSSGQLSLWGRIEVTALETQSFAMDSRMSFGIKSSESSASQIVEAFIIEANTNSVPRISFRGAVPQPVQIISGSATGPLSSLLTALAGMGLIIDNTT